MADRYYYLAPWEWGTDPEPCWHAPEGVVGLIDLRPLAETDSFGFFVSEKPLAMGYLLGRDLQGLERNTVSIWNDTLKLNAQGDSILDLLAWTLDHGDPDGASLCPPLMPTHQSIMEIHLGGHSLVRSRAWLGESDPAWPSVQAKLQRDYREIKRDAEEKASKIEGDKKLKKEEKEKLAKAVRELSAKWLGASELKFKVHGDLLIPGNMAKEPSRKPTTSISDVFTDTTGTRLNAHIATDGKGWYWLGSNYWAIMNNRANGMYYSIKYIADYALSSSDHYAEIYGGEPAAAAADKDRLVIVRSNNGSPENHYFVRFFNEVRADLYKVVAGITTTIDSDAPGSTYAYYKLKCDGSSIQSFIDGATRNSVTDTSIANGFYAGMGGRCNSSDTNVSYTSSFIAEDLLGGFQAAWARNANQFMGCAV